MITKAWPILQLSQDWLRVIYTKRTTPRCVSELCLVIKALQEEKMYYRLEPIDFHFEDSAAFRSFSMFSTVITTQLLDVGHYIRKITICDVNQQRQSLIHKHEGSESFKKNTINAAT
jgi:hypothetical protein